MNNLRAAQRQYDNAAPADFRDPFCHEDLVEEYCAEHGITVEQFIDDVTETEFWSWVKKSNKEFNL